MSTEDTPKPVAWMTMESARRLSFGGNIKGAVPVHMERSVTAKIPLFDQATIDAAVAAERERCANLCESLGSMEALDGEEVGSAAMVRVADRMAELCAVAIRMA